MAILFVHREQKEQLQKMKDFGSEPQMPDHLPPPDARLQNASSRPGMYPVWENVCSGNAMIPTLYVWMLFAFFFFSIVVRVNFLYKKCKFGESKKLMVTDL